MGHEYLHVFFPHSESTVCTTSAPNFNFLVTSFLVMFLPDLLARSLDTTHELIITCLVISPPKQSEQPGASGGFPFTAVSEGSGAAAVHSGWCRAEPSVNQA